MQTRNRKNGSREVALRLLAHDEKLYAHDKSLPAIRNLLGTGMRMLVDMEGKMIALTDSQTPLMELCRNSPKHRTEPRSR